MITHNFPKELDQGGPSRLDVLLYAHDGRGLGHTSRTIAIGMALRRLYPHLRVLFVSGTAISQSLIGRSPLDWIKLPSYASQIDKGVASGVDGPTHFSKFVLASHRARMLAQIVESMTPRVILVDHSPLGKREELLPALSNSDPENTQWVLGLRAVIGDPANFWTVKTRKAFSQYYQKVLWCGDSTVVGHLEMEKIARHFDSKPFETGYVSRFYEALQISSQSAPTLTCTVSLPWLSGDSIPFIDQLKEAISTREKTEQWRIYINRDNLDELRQRFGKTPHVQVEPVGESYVESLGHSRIAIIYGGYNSLMDVAAARIPALVVVRKMADSEQQRHLDRLLSHSGKRLIRIDESDAKKQQIAQAIAVLLAQGEKEPDFHIRGSETAAHQLINMMRAKSDSGP